MDSSPGKLSVEEVDCDVGNGLHEGQSFPLLGGVRALAFAQGHGGKADGYTNVPSECLTTAPMATHEASFCMTKGWVC